MISMMEAHLFLANASGSMRGIDSGTQSASWDKVCGMLMEGSQDKEYSRYRHRKFGHSGNVFGYTKEDGGEEERGNN
jgi:hypothetical protein